MEQIEPYRQGFRARLRGEAVEANPFAPGSPDSGRWFKGWMAQDEHLTARDDALAPLFGVRL